VFVVGDTASGVREREDVRLMDSRMDPAGNRPSNPDQARKFHGFCLSQGLGRVHPINETEIQLRTTSTEDVVLNSKDSPGSSHTVPAVLRTSQRNHLCLFASPYTMTFRGRSASPASL
jgi:hypothetical protein